MKTFSEFKEFLTKKMKMTGIYQPVVIRHLIENNGKAKLEDIAKFIAPLDEESINYYITRLKTYPKDVLKKHKIAEIPKRSHEFESLEPLSFSKKEKTDLIQICDDKISEFLKRHPSSDTASAGWGLLRAQMIAEHRACEMCGRTPEDKAELDIDHIIPKIEGGSDERKNLQVLCRKCNRGKNRYFVPSAAAAKAKIAQLKNDCIFCQIEKNRIVFEEDFFFCVKDNFPVTKHHLLLLTKRHVETAADLKINEWANLEKAFAKAREHIEKWDKSVHGYNVGFNIGACAGQTVMHAHFHIIPRREKDVPNPRGGIRGVIPGKSAY